MPFDSNINNLNHYNPASLYMTEVPQPIYQNGYKPQSEIQRLEEFSGGSFRARPPGGYHTGPYMPRVPFRPRARDSDSDSDSDDYDSDGELTGNGIKKVMHELRDLGRRHVKKNGIRVSVSDDENSDSDSDDYDSDGELTGRGIRRAFKKIRKKASKGSKKVGKAIKKTATKAGDDIKMSATSEKGIIRQVATRTLDETPQLLGKATEMGVTAYTGNPAAGKLAGKLVETGAQKGRSELDEKTGYGGKLNMSKLVDKYVSKKSSDGNKPKKAPSARNIIVQKIMQEKGLSLPQASKYIKDNNLY